MPKIATSCLSAQFMAPLGGGKGKIPTSECDLNLGFSTSPDDIYIIDRHIAL
jgi:hypothetical protein